MKKQTNKKILTIVVSILALTICFIGSISIFAYADSIQISPNTDFLSATNTFACTEYDVGQNKVSYNMDIRQANIDVMDEPQITVLTHGLNSNAGTWSNCYSESNADVSFGYDEDSIIERIRNEAGGANIFWAKMTDYEKFELRNITEIQSGLFRDSYIVQNHITDNSKHIIIVFESKWSNGSNDSVYIEFNNMLSSVVNDVSILNGGKLPKVNLIGHSRGGLTNMQYALDHPDLVASLISIGTPYFASTTARLFGKDFSGDSDGLDDILNPDVYFGYCERWNNNYERLYKNINASAFGSYHTLVSLMDIVCNDYSKTIDDWGAAGICAALTVLNAAKLTGANLINLLTSNPIIEELDYLFPNSSAVDCAEILIKEIDYDTHPLFVSWYNDILVPLDSQLGRDYGSSQHIDANGYKGFNRFIRPFVGGDADYTKVASDQPAVGHNLESRDKVIINGIVAQLDLGLFANRFLYTIKDDGTVAMDGFRGGYLSESLVIPDYIDGHVVTEISPFAFMTLNKSSITKIEIPSTIETIGMYAFADFEAVETVTISGNGLKNIGMGAFANCTLLQTIDLPAATSLISQYAFANCISLSAVNIDNSNEQYLSLDGVIYSKDLKELTFYPIGKSENQYTVNSACTEIGSCAFMGSKLSSVNLNNVVMLRDQAFMGSAQLSSVVGNKVKYVERAALQGTAWLNKEMTNEFISLGQALYCYNGSNENVVVDNYVSISPDAFLGNESIKTISIGKNTTTLGGCAFYGCKNLESVYLNNVNNIVYVGTGTFDNNSESRTIYVPYELHNAYASNELWQQYSTTTHKTKITYYLFDGMIEGKYRDEISYGEFFDLPEPKKENYYFDGWYTDKEYVNKIESCQWLSYDETLKLFAKWQPKTYTVVLNVNDENGKITTVNYEYGQTIVLPTPVRMGYTFGGWCSDSALNVFVPNTLPNTISGNFTLYAKWIANMYTITYDVNANGPGEVNFASDITQVIFDAEYHLDVPTRVGNIFNGWYYLDGTNKIFYSDDKGNAFFEKWNLTKDITLKADWTRMTYYIKITCEGKVTWVTDESGFDSYKSPIQYGTELISPEVLAQQFNPKGVSIKEGNIFRYFVKSLDSNEPIGSWKEFENLITINEIIIEIFPYFEKEQNFTLDFLNVGMSPGVNPFVASYDDKITYATPPSKTGYIFRYWRVAPVSVAPTNAIFDGTQFAAGCAFEYILMPDLSIGYEKEGVHIWLEAYYAPIDYTITLSTKYGTLPYTQMVVTYDTKINIPELDSSGRTFDGWYTSSTGGTQIANNKGIMLNNWTITGDITLYARWRTNQYTVRYNPNNGTSTATISETFTCHQVRNLRANSFSYTGYRFMGWSTQVNGSVVYLDGAQVNNLSITQEAIVNMYAVWAKLYTVSFVSNIDSECPSITGISGEKIALPTPILGGYKGTWSYWGYITGNSNISNFGYDYTILGDATLKAVWKEKTIQECYNSQEYRYEIWTYNQLNGIRNLTMYDTYNESYRINSDIYLCSDIEMVGKWTPIEHSFTGVFEGNNRTISNMNIVASKPGQYGFFQSVYMGQVKNLKFSNINITSTGNNNSDYNTIGVVAGTLDGKMENCKVLSGNITINWYNSYVGGVVGNAQGGRIYNCDNNGVNISGYGTLGGIVGFNSWGTTIEWCYNHGNITYTYNTESGCAGGIAGRNNLNGKILRCINYGTISYGGSYALNAYNRPCMAQIVGWNQEGTITDSKCYGSCNFKNMTLGQKTHCSDKEVGKTGN